MAASREERARAEEQFHRTLKKAHEAKQAVSQYEAATRATDEKTARLRALRPAKESAEASVAAEKKPVEKKPAAKKKAVSKKPAGTAADT
jgi:hypothetical protein